MSRLTTAASRAPAAAFLNHVLALSCEDEAITEGANWNDKVLMVDGWDKFGRLRWAYSICGGTMNRCRMNEPTFLNSVAKLCRLSSMLKLARVTSRTTRFGHLNSDSSFLTQSKESATRRSPRVNLPLYKAGISHFVFQLISPKPLLTKHPNTHLYAFKVKLGRVSQFGDKQ